MTLGSNRRITCQSGQICPRKCKKMTESVHTNGLSSVGRLGEVGDVYRNLMLDKNLVNSWKFHLVVRGFLTALGGDVARLETGIGGQDLGALYVDLVIEMRNSHLGGEILMGKIAELVRANFAVARGIADCNGNPKGKS